MENLCVKLLVVVGIAGIAGVAFITLTGSDKKEEDAATCPEYSGLEPFDLAAFSGLWYEVERYPNPRLEGQSCIRVTYQESSSNETGEYLNTVISFEVNGVARNLELTALYPAGNTQGRLIYNPAQFDDYNVYIIGAKYDSFHIRYRCTVSEEGVVAEEAFILSRSASLSEADMAEAKGIVADLGSDVSKFEDVTACASG